MSPPEPTNSSSPVKALTLGLVAAIAAIAGRDDPAVRAFLAFLTGDAAADILRGYGFVVPAPTS